MHETNRWGTPDREPHRIIPRARRLLGGFDLDPSSEEQFQKNVLATTYYSLLERGEDGLQLPWFGNVFCNPPGGLVLDFWRRAFSEPRVEKLFWVGFSVEQLCIMADEEYHPMDFSCCLLRSRIKFIHHADPSKERPGHANYVCAVNVKHDAFVEQFGELGRCSAGRFAQ